MPTKWEYKIVDINALRWTRTGLPADVNQKFDEWGAQGWELVATESVIRKGWFIYGSETASIVAFFKRQIDA
jgi:hypothetical protein